MYHAIRVGEPFPGGFSVMQDGAHYNFNRAGHSLLLAFHSPSSDEVQAVKSGVRKRFAFAVEQGVIFFLAKFGDQNWMDTPFTIHLVPEDYRELPPETDGTTEHALLLTVMVEARTGIVQAMNACTFTPAFTRRLHAAIRAQAERPWRGRAAHDSAIARVYRTFSTRQLVKRARAEMVVRPDPSDPIATGS
jgi:hypothetical protein